MSETVRKPIPSGSDTPASFTQANWLALTFLVGAALALALATAASLWAFGQIETASNGRRHTVAVIAGGHAFLAELRDAETGERGFVLTGDERFLEPYLSAASLIDIHLADLRSRTRLPEAHDRLDAVLPLVKAKFAELADVIELRRRGDLRAAVAVVAEGRGKRTMDAIRTEMDRFILLEGALLNRQHDDFEANMSRLFAIIIAIALFSLLLALAFSSLVYREAKNRVRNLVHIETRHLLDVQEETNLKLLAANATLQQSEEKLAVTLNSIGDAVVATDADGRLTLMNPLAAKLTGWTLADADGHLVDEIFHIISQETRQPSLVPVMETLRRGTVQGFANHTILIARDGTERSIADSCAPIRDRDGAVVGAVLVFRDVTAEYATQNAARDSTALVQAILDTVSDGIVTIHADGGIIDSSNVAAQRMFGYDAAELVGQKIGMLIPELGQDSHRGSLEYYSASAAARAAGLGREVTGRRKDASTFPLELGASELMQGRHRYFTGILRDITIRNRTDAALHEKTTELEGARTVAEKANRAKSEFLSGMSHELRTPLNAILGFAQLMESGTPAPTQAQKRNLDQILKAGWYLLELINEILDLAVIESGKLTLSREPVSLAEVIFECRAMIEPQAQKRGISMQFPRFDIPLFVNADRTRLKQVLINLLFNAVKYNKPNGSVTMDYVLSPPESIRISVRDTGAGLAPEQLVQLFQPFNRLGKDSSVEEGTGIGLVVTKRLVELMGGTIGAESFVSVGSVFWIELCLTAAPLRKIAEAELLAIQGTQMPAGTPARTVLYVEDNPANLSLIEQLVARRADLRLLSATDGEVGIQFARAYRPEVILMDINLPGISGLDAMHILRLDSATAHIPIIALSANAVPHDIEKALEAGFFNYLTKPIKVDQFMNALDAALKHAQSNPTTATSPEPV
jgi:PAS domain S-box-containing protein